MTARLSRQPIRAGVMFKSSRLCRSKDQWSRVFACTLSKKLHLAGVLRRKLLRNLKSVSTKLDADIRSGVSQGFQDLGGIDETIKTLNDVPEFEDLQQSTENVIPQQEWDDLLDLAFETVRDAPIEIFDDWLI